jgi:hypothetical protein
MPSPERREVPHWSPDVQIEYERFLARELVDAADDASCPPRVRTLLRRGLVELQLWQEGKSSRGLRAAHYALAEYQLHLAGRAALS